MNILTDGNDKTLAIVLSREEGRALVTALQIAMANMTKNTKAYKLAKEIDDNLPVY